MIHIATPVGESGPALLYLHAFPLDGNVWRYQETVLSRTVTHYRIDFPGFGVEPLVNPSMTMSDYAIAVREAMEQLQLKRVIVAGISMGGYVAFELWRRCPERIAGFILSNTRAEADTDEVKRRREESIAVIQRGQSQLLVESLLETMPGSSAKQRAEFMDALSIMARRASMQGMIAALHAMKDRIDSTATLETIAVPALVIAGTEDRLSPPEVVRRIHDGIKGSSWCEIEGAGHLAPLEQPMQVNDAITRWMRQYWDRLK